MQKSEGGPIRIAKSHSALEAMVRGSPGSLCNFFFFFLPVNVFVFFFSFLKAWKQRLKKRALNRVESARAAILARARGDFPMARRELKSILDDEVCAMDLESHENVDLYDDLPPLSQEEYEDIMCSLCDELEREEDAERYEEFERFEEEALLAAIESQGTVSESDSLGCQPMDVND